jgi:hypothetical protein
MADEDENLVLTVGVDDEVQAPPETPITEAKTAKPPPVPGPGAQSTAPKAGLEELQKQIENEKAQRNRVAEQNRRLQAERDRALQLAQEADRRGVASYEMYNQEQIRATQEQIDALSAQHEGAMQDGDFKTAADLTRKIGRLSGQLALFERDQGALAQQREQLGQQPRPQPQPQAPVSTDPVERAIAGRSEPTRNFLRKHPELVRQDGSLKRAAIDAHEAALDAGFAVESDGYFTHIESMLNGGQPAAGGEQPMQPRQQQAPMTAAPVARSGGPGSGGAPAGTFIMTPKMRRLAEEAGVTPAEWATNYLRLLKEKRITPIT